MEPVIDLGRILRCEDQGRIKDREGRFDLTDRRDRGKLRLKEIAFPLTGLQIMEHARTDKDNIALLQRALIFIIFQHIFISNRHNDLKTGMPVPWIRFKIRIVIKADIRILSVIHGLMNPIQIFNHDIHLTGQARWPRQISTAIISLILK
jgi:hypothetical protein